MCIPEVQVLINSQPDGYWSEHPDLDDWIYEVRNRDTRKGFWEWLAHREGILDD